MFSELERQRNAGDLAKVHGNEGASSAGGGWAEGEPGERLMHEFAKVLAEAADAQAVSRALTTAAHQLTGSDSVRFVPHPGRGVAASSGVAAIALRCGAKNWGWLMVKEPGGQTGIVRHRLETLGMMAACVLERLENRRRVDVSESNHRPFGRLSGRALERVADQSESEFEPSTPGVYDAAFLNTVFPLVLSQARRYSEPLSVLYVAIDRLSGIRALLGEDQVDRTVRRVGRKIGTLIRSSDFVARLDDDRLMVVLPRVEADGAMLVANKLCRIVAEGGSHLSDVPGLTLSIGVASFPSCASNLSELHDAAHAALSVARVQGSNCAASASPKAAVRAFHLVTCGA